MTHYRSLQFSLAFFCLSMTQISKIGKSTVEAIKKKKDLVSLFFLSLIAFETYIIRKKKYVMEGRRRPEKVKNVKIAHIRFNLLLK